MSEEYLDEPRSWREFVVDAIERRSHALYALGTVVFGGFTLLGVGMAIHIDVTTIGLFARAEAQSGTVFADEIERWGLYLNTAIYLLAFGACVWGLIGSQ